ncbi:MAG: hypothetical protein CM1200mP34_2240 [Verrucomicrobiales bacterium]|nr:MAG: hypothetical protein CM1200mP34_2240 [Verrucomicrobiales bacterium]
MLQQQTLAKPASFSGIGLHSGNKVEMTLLPAPPNSGITFRRVDLDSRAEIPAQVGNVAETDRSTTISKGNPRCRPWSMCWRPCTGSGSPTPWSS